MLAYPFSSVLNIMKPSKIDSTKTTQVSQLKKILVSPNYIWEEKLDGISLMAIGGRLYSNKVGKTGWPAEKTDKMPYVAEELKQFGPKAIFDGEGYLPGWKSNTVCSILNCNTADSLSKQTSGEFMQYHVYDYLRTPDGTWINNQPFEVRRHMLEELFAHAKLSHKAVILNPCHEVSETDPMAAFERIVSNGLEGIVLKHKQGTYQPGKRPLYNQVKLKASLEDDAIVIGFNEATRKYSGTNLENWPYWENGEPVSEHYAKGLIGSIQIGKYRNGQLVPVGNVTGINESERVDMTQHPEKYLNKVIIIKAMEKTSEGMYRHANYKGLHPDKNASECIIE